MVDFAKHLKNKKMAKEQPTENKSSNPFAELDLTQTQGKELTSKIVALEVGETVFFQPEEIVEMEGKEGSNDYEAVKGIAASPLNIKEDFAALLADSVIISVVKKGIADGTIEYGKTVLKIYNKGMIKSKTAGKGNYRDLQIIKVK